ncbi:hypothetical protein PHMEG_00030306 [Phytophthora megakarya]|uniref:Uncharacterized protein n=1 Tax=Phytophthora megakarya TaxID=4795 RepID=A0A225V0X0_9STRA|nr:hypothetical protein PHMEG_00030306 [Phytophthora megakarya]
MVFQQCYVPFQHLHFNMKSVLSFVRTEKLLTELQQWLFTNCSDKVKGWRFEVHNIDLETLWD